MEKKKTTPQTQQALKKQKQINHNSRTVEKRAGCSEGGNFKDHLEP